MKSQTLTQFYLRNFNNMSQPSDETHPVEPDQTVAKRGKRKRDEGSDGESEMKKEKLDEATPSDGSSKRKLERERDETDQHCEGSKRKKENRDEKDKNIQNSDEMGQRLVGCMPSNVCIESSMLKCF